MYYNAELNVNDNDITVTFGIEKPCFQAIQINDGSNVTIVDKTYNDDLSNSEIHTNMERKIQTLTLKLKDFGGLYEFGDCKEFASILYTEGKFCNGNRCCMGCTVKISRFSDWKTRNIGCY